MVKLRKALWITNKALTTIQFWTTTIEYIPAVTLSHLILVEENAVKSKVVRRFNQLWPSDHSMKNPFFTPQAPRRDPSPGTALSKTCRGFGSGDQLGEHQTSWNYGHDGCTANLLPRSQGLVGHFNGLEGLEWLKCFAMWVLLPRRFTPATNLMKSAARRGVFLFLQQYICLMGWQLNHTFREYSSMCGWAYIHIS